jgi:hypothetical protein
LDDAEIRILVQALDTASATEEEAAWAALKPLGAAVVPYLKDFYPKARKWQCRAALVFHAARYARTSEAAFGLGLLALRDKSTLVRYRACGLCAYTLREQALLPLRALLDHSDARTVADAEAAIDAIRGRNHHYFVDRSHSGRSFWVVNDEDRQGI